MLFLVVAAISIQAQQVVPFNETPVSGSCAVSLFAGPSQREKCEISSEDGSVPNGFTLVIEHVSAACWTTPGRGIYTLALITRLSAENRTIRTTHIPVAVQASAENQVRLVGAQKVRIYGGPATSVEVLASTTQSAPAGETGCDVSFSGVIRRLNQ